MRVEYEKDKKVDWNREDEVESKIIVSSSEQGKGKAVCVRLPYPSPSNDSSFSPPIFPIRPLVIALKKISLKMWLQLFDQEKISSEVLKCMTFIQRQISMVFWLEIWWDAANYIGAVPGK